MAGKVGEPAAQGERSRMPVRLPKIVAAGRQGATGPEGWA